MSSQDFRRHTRYLFTSLALTLAAQPLTARAYGGDEDAFLSDLPVVLSATRLKQSRHDTPTSVTVIDRHMIEASGARTIVDALRLVPGMQTAYATGNQQVVTYHGLSDEYSRRMQVLVDGRSIYLPSFGGITWSSLPLALEDIDRIEVIRGPNSATYGSNSFLGVISIITRHAAEEKGDYARLTRGSNDIGDAVLRHSGGEGKLDYRMTLKYQQDDGFKGVTHYGGDVWDNHDWGRVSLLTTRFDYQATPSDRLELQAGLAKAHQGEGALFSDPADPPRTLEKMNDFLQLRWEHSGRNGHDFHLQFHREEHLTQDSFMLGPDTISLDAAQVNDLVGVPLPGFLTASVSLDPDIRTQRYDLEFQHRYTPDTGTRFVWGSSLRTDRARSPGWFGTGDWIYNHWFRLFGNVEHRLTDRLLVNAGTMLERNTLIGNDISPRLALNYRLADRHTLRLAWSKASRTPAMIEEFTDVEGLIEAQLTVPGVGSMDFSLPEQLLLSSGGLTRERITSSEIGYFGELFDRRLQLDVRLFYDELKELITQTTDVHKDVYLLDKDVIDFENTDRARLKGIETQIDWRPHTHTIVRFGHSYLETDSEDVWEHYSTSTPRNSYLLFASHRLPRRLDVSMAYHYTSEMEWLEWEPADDISRLDLRIAKSFFLQGYDAQVALVTQNITGTHVEFRRGNRFEPRAFLQLSLSPR